MRAAPKVAAIHQTGAQDVFRWEEVEVCDLGQDKVRVRNHAIGVNYVNGKGDGGIIF